MLRMRACHMLAHGIHLMHMVVCNMANQHRNHSGVELTKVEEECKRLLYQTPEHSMLCTLIKEVDALHSEFENLTCVLQSMLVCIACSHNATAAIPTVPLAWMPLHEVRLHGHM